MHVPMAAQDEGRDVLDRDVELSCAMNVRKRAESSTPAMPMTRCFGKPERRNASWRHGVERVRHDDEGSRWATDGSSRPPRRPRSRRSS